MQLDPTPAGKVSEQRKAELEMREREKTKKEKGKGKVKERDKVKKNGKLAGGGKDGNELGDCGLVGRRKRKALGTGERKVR